MANPKMDSNTEEGGGKHCPLQIQEVLEMEIKCYEDIEKMFADLENIRKQAIESFNNCTDKQKALIAGDIFVTKIYGLIIFNKIVVLDDVDVEEFEDAESMGYVMVEAWSNACPDGEMGSVHRSQALYKLVDGGRRTSDQVLRAYINIWKIDGEVSVYDLQWLMGDGNLEVLT